MTNQETVFVDQEWENKYWELKNDIGKWSVLTLFGFLETLVMFAFWVTGGQYIDWSIIWIVFVGFITLMSVYVRHFFRVQLGNHLCEPPKTELVKK
jgi:hypothetical protein